MNDARFLSTIPSASAEALDSNTSWGATLVRDHRCDSVFNASLSISQSSGSQVDRMLDQGGAVCDGVNPHHSIPGPRRVKAQVPGSIIAWAGEGLCGRGPERGARADGEAYGGHGARPSSRCGIHMHTQ